MRRTLSAFAVALAVVAVTFTAGALLSEVPTPAEAGGCMCPLVYAPVTCDHDKTYPNQCEADCHHAKNCVPSGI
jgi:hypothetical protein